TALAQWPQVMPVTGKVWVLIASSWVVVVAVGVSGVEQQAQPLVWAIGSWVLWVSMRDPFLSVVGGWGVQDRTSRAMAVEASVAFSSSRAGSLLACATQWRRWSSS